VQEGTRTGLQRGRVLGECKSLDLNTRETKKDGRGMGQKIGGRGRGGRDRP
jgi:hypothetical protein